MYDAVTLDTSTLRAAGYRFDSGILSALKQFKNGATQFLLSEIVIRESYRHVLEDEKDRKRDLQNFGKRLAGINEYSSMREKIEKDADELDPAKIANERISRFFSESGAKLIPASQATIEEITLGYFQGSPPFDKSGKKKNEFPDSIALYGIKRWAKESNKKVLVATKDKDWIRFCEGEDCLDSLEEISDVLAQVQKNVEQATGIVQKFLSHLRSSDGADDLATLWDEIEYATSSMDVLAEGQSALHFEEDYIEIEINEVDLSAAIQPETVAVVSVGSSEISFSLKIDMSINATAYFNLSVYDSIDKDYVAMGSNSTRIENEEFEGEYLITINGDLSGPSENLTVVSVDILDYPIILDFGEIEMDNGDEHWDASDELQLDIFEHGSSETDTETTTEPDSSATAA